MPSMASAASRSSRNMRRPPSSRRRVCVSSVRRRRCAASISTGSTTNISRVRTRRQRSEAVITYTTLSLAEANIVLDAAQKKAEELGIPEVLCVADVAGYPIALRRLDGGKVTSVQIAMNKAFTAAGHRKPTHNYKNAYPG